MVIPGLLIEYFINGALALVWLYPLCDSSNLIEKLKVDVSNTLLAIFIAASLYLIGMTIDIVAWLITKSYKKRRVRKNVIKNFFKNDKIGESSIYREVLFSVCAPEVAKEFSMRSSRDRVARGAIINSIISTIVYAIILSSYTPILIGLITTSICFFIWQGFEKVSYAYELSAEKILNKKFPELKQANTLKTSGEVMENSSQTV